MIVVEHALPLVGCLVEIVVSEKTHVECRGGVLVFEWFMERLLREWQQQNVLGRLTGVS